MFKTPERWKKPHWRVLCYHNVTKDHLDSFRFQLLGLIEMGFSCVSFDQGLSLLSEGELNRPVMSVTFDDGDRTIYENVLPTLDRLAIKGLVYITADYVRHGATYRDEHPLPALTPAQIREWIQAGHAVGSHSLTHAPLNLCSERRLRQECYFSKTMLEDFCEQSIRHLSYPWGQYSEQTCRLVRINGLYDSAATIDRGMMFFGQDPYKLRRDLCDARQKPLSMIRKMILADHWYWLRRLRPRCKGYWASHPEEKWDILSEV